MVDLRKIVIIFVIAVLYAILVQTIIEAVHPSPKYEDYCQSLMKGAPYSEPQRIDDKGNLVQSCQYIDTTSCIYPGQVEYAYNASGCPQSYTCNMCQQDFNNDNEKYNFIVFMVSAILGLIAVAIGLYMPTEENSLNEWIGTGFMLGGLFSIFFGTARYFMEMGRYVRPIVIFVELAIVIYIGYKKLKK